MILPTLRFMYPMFAQRLSFPFRFRDTLNDDFVDRYLALHLHLRYRELVTTQRVAIVEAVFLCGSIAVAVTMMFNQIISAVIAAIVGAGICLPTSFVALMKVFVIIRQHERKVVEDIINLLSSRLPRGQRASG